MMHRYAVIAREKHAARLNHAAMATMGKRVPLTALTTDAAMRREIARLVASLDRAQRKG